MRVKINRRKTMTEDINIEIKKDCESCLFQNECGIKELNTKICVWFLHKDRYKFVKSHSGLTYIEEVKK